MRPAAAIGLACLLGGSTGLTAQASQSRTATLKVAAHVVADCMISTTPLNFGNYDPVGVHATQPLDGTTQLSVVCTKGTIAAIEMDQGQHASGGSASRRMAGPGGDLLGYEIYSDVARRARWGTQQAGVSLTAAPSTAPRLVTVYGRVAAKQDVVAGSYADEVIVTVRF
jgi:spore coat protein U-like protein